MKKTRNYNTEEVANILAANQAVLDVIPDLLEKMKQELAVTLAQYTPPDSELGKSIRKMCCGYFPPDPYFYTSIEGKEEGVSQIISMGEEYPAYKYHLLISAKTIGSRDILFPFDIELTVKPFTFLRREELEIKWMFEARLEQYGIIDTDDDVLKGKNGIIHLINSINSLFVELQTLHSNSKNNENYLPEVKRKLSILKQELNWLESELETNLEKLI